MKPPQSGYLPGMNLAKAVVVVPAHNELAHLPRCLRALATSAVCLPVPVLTVVVLDATDDGSDRLVGQFGPDVHFVTVDAGNVGAARAAGFEYARTLCDGVDPARTWYATTDADSVVPADWLLRMTASDADMVLGVVQVSAWRHYPAEVVRRYLRAYRSKGPGHNHIHGANMGFRADAYWAVGGFRALPTGEDVELVDRFEAAGSAHPPRRQACRWRPRTDRDGRAPGGFAPPSAGAVGFGVQADAPASGHERRSGRALAGRGRIGPPAAGFGSDRAAMAPAGRTDPSRRRRRPAGRGAHRRRCDPRRVAGPRPQTRSAVGGLGRRIARRGAAGARRR